MMEEYTNKWNINMNTLGMADYNVDEEVKVYGFAALLNGVVESFLFAEESECAREWYNAHCSSAEQISELCEFVLNQGYTETDLEIAKTTINKLPLKLLSEQEKNDITESEYMRYSMICNSLLRGNTEDTITEEQMKQFGHGLIYWENEKQAVFFDNRMAVMFRKLRELQKENIYPICIRLEKNHYQPIPVAEGRKQLVEIAQQENLKVLYYDLQKYAY